MKPIELLGVVTGVFEKLEVPYAVVGSMASSYYGEPRFTNDIDVIAALTEAKVAEFVKAFSPDDYYVSESAIRQAVAARGSSTSFSLNGGSRRISLS